MNSKAIKFTRAIEYFGNEDGEFWVPVDAATEDEAGQYLADLIELGVYAAGVSWPLVQECEEGHTCKAPSYCEAHPGCPNTPCPPASKRECWGFQDFDPACPIDLAEGIKTYVHRKSQ